jgi:hypothetical protein
MTASPLKDWQSFLEAKITALTHYPALNLNLCHSITKINRNTRR